MLYDRRSKYLLGKQGEEMAAEYLTAKGFRVVKCNYRGTHGEIDVIAWERETLVFVEIKTSKSSRYGAPETWVTPRKQKRMARTALKFIHENHLEHSAVRFDVVAIDLGSGKRDIRHIVNAFWMPDMGGYF